MDFGQGAFETNEQGISFATIELQEVPSHSTPDVLKAGGEGCGRKGSGGFSGDVDLCVVCVAVEMNTMVSEDCAQGNEVDDE